MILVTGGAGFIGSNFVLDWLKHSDEPVVNLDKLSYAGNLPNLASLDGDRRHVFVRGDIGDQTLVGRLLVEYRPRALINFAAESHVDRSIHGAGAFIETNLVCAFRLLEAVRGHWKALLDAEKRAFRFVHVSTDEVYGSLGPDDAAFTETTPYTPNSPYAASKAGSDHLVRAWHHTYGLPTLTTNCSNNYGPFQFPEKLIALMILNATEGRPLPVYGDGRNVRDWLYVGDHCSAIRAVLERGQLGDVYNIGGESERENITVVRTICALLDEFLPRSPHRPHERLISYVKDRPGHDRRYAIDCSKIRRELEWSPSIPLEEGLRRTVEWYLANQDWVDSVQMGAHREWIETNYGQARAA
jgi:dTDP-glucose 4,6-dehydratase